MNRQGKLLWLLLMLALLLGACGHSEIESTILTTAPEQTVRTTTPVTTAPQPSTETTVPTTAPEITETEAAEPAIDTTPSSTEPETEGTESAEARDYVLNKNTKKFHFPDCGSVSQIKESNRSDYHGTRQELLDRGYSPCGRCKP